MHKKLDVLYNVNKFQADIQHELKSIKLSPCELKQRHLIGYFVKIYVNNNHNFNFSHVNRLTSHFSEEEKISILSRIESCEFFLHETNDHIQLAAELFKFKYAKQIDFLEEILHENSDIYTLHNKYHNHTAFSGLHILLSFHSDASPLVTCCAKLFFEAPNDSHFQLLMAFYKLFNAHPSYSPPLNTSGDILSSSNPHSSIPALIATPVVQLANPTPTPSSYSPRSELLEITQPTSGNIALTIPIVVNNNPFSRSNSPLQVYPQAHEGQNLFSAYPPSIKSPELDHYPSSLPMYTNQNWNVPPNYTNYNLPPTNAPYHYPQQGRDFCSPPYSQQPFYQNPPYNNMYLPMTSYLPFQPSQQPPSIPNQPLQLPQTSITTPTPPPFSQQPLQLSGENSLLTPPPRAINQQEVFSHSTAERKDWELSHEEINLNKVIGTGSFGEVWLGEWQGNLVAVKKISAHHGAKLAENDIAAFKQEIEIMAYGFIFLPPSYFLLNIK